MLGYGMFGLSFKIVKRRKDGLDIAVVPVCGIPDARSGNHHIHDDSSAPTHYAEYPGYE
jgi:hypothetical protein